MPDQAKQRFLELNVGEISVVDTPAIEIEFLVMKRMEEDSMDPNATPVETETTKNPDAELVEIETGASPEDAAVNKALEQVASMVENIAKAAGVQAPKPAEAKTETETETTKAAGEGEEVDTEKAKHPQRGLFMKQLKTAGIKGDALTKAMVEFDKQFMPGEDIKNPEKGAHRTKTQKDADGGAVADDSEQQTIKALDALEFAVQKAKRFTPAREAALKAVVEQLTKLLHEMTTVPTGMSPKNPLSGGNSFGASGVQTLTKAVESLSETINKSVASQSALNERVEAIEKSRTPTQSIETDGDTDSQKTEKSFWAGVL